MRRLERNNDELLHLQTSLKSYVCEPKTYSLFERLQGLKKHLENLRKRNQELIEALKGHKNCLEEQLERSRQQFEEYRELERNVLEYIGMAKMHC